MLAIIHQTTEEKLTMYMKLTKHELAVMLVNSNEALDAALLRERNPPLYVEPTPIDREPLVTPVHVTTWSRLRTWHA